MTILASRKGIVRWLLAALYLAVGIQHLVGPALFVEITPHWVPEPELVVRLTGWAEIAGAFALAQGFSPALQRLAGWAFAAYALCVWPANINHFMLDMAKPDGGAGLGYHVPRFFLQPVLIWAALWCSGVLERFRKG